MLCQIYSFASYFFFLFFLRSQGFPTEAGTLRGGAQGCQGCSKLSSVGSCLPIAHTSSSSALAVEGAAVEADSLSLPLVLAREVRGVAVGLLVHNTIFIPELISSLILLSQYMSSPSVPSLNIERER